jgi:menaquinone-specific isochorismate synthase
LSLAEPPQRSLLQDWVDRSVSEGVAEAMNKREPVLHVSTRKLDEALPLGVFDTTIEDVHFFGGRDRVVLGVGAARAFELNPAKPIRSRTTMSLLGLESLSDSDASNVIVMGGWGFLPGRGPGEKGIWRDFPSSRWVVPALTFTSRGGETHVAMAVHLGPSSDATRVSALYRTLVDGVELRRTDAPSDAGTEAIPTLKSARSVPSKKTWASLASGAIESISRDELKKVVLARAVALTFSGAVPASRVLKRLITLNPDSTVFAIKKRDSVFLGATPESLLSVRGGEVEVDCLAASSPRGTDRAADDTLGARLLADPKSKREHQFVVKSAVSALSPISSRIEVPSSPVLKKLTTIQHLYTPVRATLNKGEDAWSAAFALWPNPAIGGEPKEKAVRWIRKFEKFSRGWYSGVVGVINAHQDEADLVVAIRSGVIRGRQAALYAGAGLVAGSDPREELEETSWKLRAMCRALGVDEDGGW